MSEGEKRNVVLGTLWYHASILGKWSCYVISWWRIKPPNCVYNPVYFLYDFGHRTTHGVRIGNIRIDQALEGIIWVRGSRMPEGSSSENQAPMIKPVAYQASPLEEFDFSKPTEWTKWIKRFERFRSASGLSKGDEESQLNALLYSMGSKRDGLTTDNSKKYDVGKDKFDGYFVKRRNTIFEREKFHRRKQETGEPVEFFITDLYGLTEHCQFGLLPDEMIRDRIVVGLADQNLSEKFQLDADLTLEKAIKRVRQS